MQDAQKSATYDDAAAETAEPNELDEPRWSVVSFERCEASHLTFAQAAEKMSELDAAGVAGLCLVTDDVGARVDRPQA
jgi:hypothetical protein